jgi:hypothetical protein
VKAWQSTEELKKCILYCGFRYPSPVRLRSCIPVTGAGQDSNTTCRPSATESCLGRPRTTLSSGRKTEGNGKKPRFEGVFMLFTTRLITLLCLSFAFAYAGNWPGTLVDSKCFAIAELNVNPTDTLTYVDRDQNQEIRLCSPGAKTKSFAVVQHDGESFKLDSAGNAKASEIVRNAGKKSSWAVLVTGDVSGNTIKVDSISMNR